MSSSRVAVGFCGLGCFPPAAAAAAATVPLTDVDDCSCTAVFDLFGYAFLSFVSVGAWESTAFDGCEFCAIVRLLVLASSFYLQFGSSPSTSSAALFLSPGRLAACLCLGFFPGGTSIASSLPPGKWAPFIWRRFCSNCRKKDTRFSWSDRQLHPLLPPPPTKLFFRPQMRPEERG
eukprot:GHVT01072418.1.p1 GENE.GHVT01072418.1~~GHVT01072418.1.p1  ORF type:complete len:176 (+),score=27.50 GHVT01072418.1:1321-1848(+)